VTESMTSQPSTRSSEPHTPPISRSYGTLFALGLPRSFPFVSIIFSSYLVLMRVSPTFWLSSDGVFLLAARVVAHVAANDARRQVMIQYLNITLLYH